MSDNWKGFSDEELKVMNNNNSKSNKLAENNKTLKPTKNKNDRNFKQIQSGKPKFSKIDGKPTEIDNVNSINSKQLNQNVKSDEKDLTDFENMQLRQKLIEQENKKRTELLTIKIAKRKKATEAETQRLAEIQKEFDKLDALLSKDVMILRNKIEAANFEYSEAEKIYKRAEKDYLQSKQNLKEKLEKKELLKEHLATIISDNEERKALKLNELLNRLSTTNLDEEKTYN